MSGSRKLYLIPVNALEPQQLSPPIHGATDADMARWMGNVPQINRMRDAGYSESSFDRLRASSDQSQRELGETEYRLYRDDTSAIKAGYDGQRIDVEGGRHRVEAARAAGVDRVPVQVWASDSGHNSLEQRYGPPVRERVERDRTAPPRDRSRGLGR